MQLIPVNPADRSHLEVLYDLLAERTPEQSISHKKMPTWEEHVAFVSEKADAYRFGCYTDWCLAQNDADIVGAVYLTRDNEIGVSVFRRFQRQGFGPEAVGLLLDKHRGASGPRRFLANVAPGNEPSRRMFEQLGFKLIQVTYALEAE